MIAICSPLNSTTLHFHEIPAHGVRDFPHVSSIVLLLRVQQMRGTAMLPAQIGTRKQSIDSTRRDAFRSEGNLAISRCLDRVKHWRKRAEQLRATADQFVVPSAQDSLRRTAAMYQHMAEHEEALLTGIPPESEKAG